MKSSILDEYRKHFGDSTLTEEQVLARADAESSEMAGKYQKLDMEAFVSHVGGYGTISVMNRINEKLDNSRLCNGKLIPRDGISTDADGKESIDEWKKGFMEGYDEAYRKLMNELR